MGFPERQTGNIDSAACQCRRGRHRIRLYRREPDSPCHVDLQAHSTRGEGNKVVRYMPVALVHTRAWLKNAIEEGQSDDARMILRGNLKDYPFVDPKLGLFRVTVKARGTSLHYADGWPRIDNIKGDVLIERNFIEVHAVSGEIGGTRLGKVRRGFPNSTATTTWWKSRGSPKARPPLFSISSVPARCASISTALPTPCAPPAPPS